MRCRLSLRISQIIVVVAAPALLMAQAAKGPVIQDGKPAVTTVTPAPKGPTGKPVFSGIWGTPSTDERKMLVARGVMEQGRQEQPALTDWAAERYGYNRDSRPGSKLEGFAPSNFGGRPELNPMLKCVPPGTAWLITGWNSISPQEFIQSDKRIMIFYEYDHTIRQIWMDGRKHPETLEPSFVGHSIGSWEGDTLVVDTVGMKPEPWLTSNGHVASAGLHIVEHYRRLDNDTMEVQLTYDDPKAFTKPWNRKLFLRYRPNWEMIEGAVRCYPGSEDRNAQEDHFDSLFTTN